MINPICSKGAVRSQIQSIESITIISSLFEVIDNRKHSNSKKVFIDIDIHNSICIIGYSESAKRVHINNTVKWFNSNNNQKIVNNIASKGIGLKFFEFKLLGKWKHISFCKDNNEYFYTEINTIKINDVRDDDTVSDEKFETILKTQTDGIKSDDELKRSEEDIFKNVDSKYPFKPNTIFLCKKMNITNSFDIYKNKKGGYDFENILKRLRIKYYNEIVNGLELFIKLPGYTEFKEIKTNDSIDIIGTTNKSDELEIDFFIDKNSHLGYTFRIREKSYKFGKNGSSKRREKIENITKSPDFRLTHFINNINKTNIKKYIIGKSIEKLYTGMYIDIGNTFINDEATNWNIDNRNMPGSSNYRCVLKCISEESKSELKTWGLKSLFDLSTMTSLHEVCKHFTNIYKGYINKNKPNNPDDYVVVTSTSNKQRDKNKNLSGYFYVTNVGKNFYKFGISSTHKRIWEHGYNKTIKKCKTDFLDIIIYEKPITVILPLTKIENVNVLEQEIKCFINNNSQCITYDNKTGDDIREIFFN